MYKIGYDRWNHSFFTSTGLKTPGPLRRGLPARPLRRTHDSNEPFFVFGGERNTFRPRPEVCSGYR